MVAETNMYVEREEIGRPDYYPFSPGQARVENHTGCRTRAVRVGR